MELRKFKDKELENYIIMNEYGDTRTGFYHKSTLFLGSNAIEQNKVHYINRTWEHYRYQTSMVGVVNKAAQHWVDYYLAKFKTENNINRMTQKNKKLFEEYLKDKKEIITYNKMLEELREYYC